MREIENVDDQLLDHLVGVERAMLEQDAQELREKPTDPVHYKSVLVSLMQTLGYENISDEPPKAMTEAEIEQHVARYRSELGSHWQSPWTI